MDYNNFYSILTNRAVMAGIDKLVPSPTQVSNELMEKYPGLKNEKAGHLMLLSVHILGLFLMELPSLRKSLVDVGQHVELMHYTKYLEELLGANLDTIEKEWTLDSVLAKLDALDSSATKTSS